LYTEQHEVHFPAPTEEKAQAAPWSRQVPHVKTRFPTSYHDQLRAKERRIKQSKINQSVTPTYKA